MRRFVLLALVSAIAAVVFAASPMAAGKSLGPPGGTIYAFDEAFHTVGTPTSLPNRGPTDTLPVP